MPRIRSVCVCRGVDLDSEGGEDGGDEQHHEEGVGHLQRWPWMGGQIRYTARVACSRGVCMRRVRV